MKRKSPIKHHVRSYVKKKGTSVHDYDRGKGERPKKISKPSLRHSTKQQTSNNFQVVIRYTNLPNEVFPVTAKDYPQAIELGLLSRLHITPPYELDVKKLD